MTETCNMLISIVRPQVRKESYLSSDMIISMRTILISSILAFSVLFQTAHAQITAQGLNPQMSIDLQPPYPKPGQEVTATINDYSGMTYGSEITWVLDGGVIPDAQNQRSAVVIAGEIGETTVIEAVLSLPQGGTEVLRTQIQPAYIDIIIEPQTRVPDFYLGRSLPSIGSIVNATALVNTGVFRNDLVYTWRLNRQVIERGPIRGRNQVSFETPRGVDAILSLQVTEPTGKVLGQRAILLPSVYPSLHFYEVSSLLGIKQIPVKGELPFVGNTLTVRAEPFHLDTNVFNNPDVSEWEVNNQASSPSAGNPYEVTLQKNSESGQINLNFHVRDTTQVLQGVDESIRITF